jgi:hypothetical protein
MAHGSHFLLSAKARTLSLKAVFQMGEDSAYNLFCQMRWPETDGVAYPYSDRAVADVRCGSWQAKSYITSDSAFQSFIDIRTI